MMMQIIFSIIILLLLIMILMFVRNDWVYQKRVHFIDTYFKIIQDKTDLIKIIGDVENLKFIIPPTKKIDITLWSYRKMMLHFWIWDFYKMVKSKDEYQKYLEEHAAYRMPDKP